MRRRDFLARSIGTSLTAYLGLSGVTVADREGGKRGIRSGLSALNPVSKYARSYVPPENSLDPLRPQTLTFDIIGWRTDKGRQVVSTPVLGEVAVKRNPLEDAVEYEVLQDLGKREKLGGHFRCATDHWHSLVSWEFEYSLDSSRKDIAHMSRTRQAGRREGSNIVVATDGVETVLANSAPLLCRWGLMDMTSRMEELCRTGDRFIVLHEPSGLRPDQRFREDLSGAIGNGEEVSVRTFLQTGPATIPTHWIVDPQGRPLFVSTFLVSWALKAIS